MRITELCEKRGYTKYRLSQLTEMSQTALGNILNKKSIPTVVTLERICDAFGITLAQFFAEDGGRLNLTEDQNEILEIWDNLESKEREILMTFLSVNWYPLRTISFHRTRQKFAWMRSWLRAGAERPYREL